MGSPAILARNLERIRKARGYTQENLALDADVSRSQIANIKRRSHGTSLAVLDRLAKALGVETWQLIAGDLPIESVASSEDDTAGSYPSLAPLRLVKTQTSKRKLRG